MKINSATKTEKMIFAVSLIITAGMFLMLAAQLNIKDSRLAIDWKMIWYSMDRGDVHWGHEMLYNPPWALVFLLPLSFLPLEMGWGLLMFLLLVVLIFSVPRCSPTWRRWVITILLMISYPVLRDCIDANLEAIVIAAVLLLLVAYHEQRPVLFAFSALLATLKPQAVLLLMPVIGWYAYQTMPRRDLWKIGAILFAVIVPTMVWGGKPWLDATLHNSHTYGMALSTVWHSVLPQSIILVLQIGIASLTLWVAYRGNQQISHPKAALLSAASLLVAPYSNAHSIILILALGVIPLIINKPRIGWPLLALYNIPFLKFMGLSVEFEGPFWHFILFVSWIILVWYVYRSEYHRIPSAAGLGSEQIVPG